MLFTSPSLKAPKLKALEGHLARKPRTKSCHCLVWSESDKGSVHEYNSPHKKRDRNTKLLHSISKVLGIKPWFHSVSLNDLSPYTKYSFSVSQNNSRSQKYYFITPPARGVPFKLLFGGDSRTDRAKRREINSSLKTYFLKNKSVIALVHGGDFISNGFSWKQWDAWLEDYQMTILDDGRVLPLIPTKGNHEISSKLFNKIFFWKRGLSMRSNYFVTRFGALTLYTQYQYFSCRSAKVLAPQSSE